MISKTSGWKGIAVSPQITSTSLVATPSVVRYKPYPFSRVNYCEPSLLLPLLFLRILLHTIPVLLSCTSYTPCLAASSVLFDGDDILLSDMASDSKIVCSVIPRASAQVKITLFHAAQPPTQDVLLAQSVVRMSM